MRLFNQKSLKVKKDRPASVINNEKLEIEELQNQKGKIEKQYKDIHVKTEGILEEYNKIEKNIYNISGEYKVKKEQLSTLNIEIYKLQGEKDELYSEIMNLESELSFKRGKSDKNIQISLDNANRKHEDMKNKTEILRIEFEDIQNNIGEANTRLQLLHKQSQAITEEMREKNNTLKIREAEIEKVNRLIKNKVDKSEDETKTLSELNQEKDTVDQNIIQRKKVLLDLDHQIQKYKEELKISEEKMFLLARKQEKIDNLIPKIKKYCKLAGIKNPFD